MDEEELEFIIKNTESYISDITKTQQILINSISKLTDWTTNASIASLAFIVNTIVQIDLRRGIGSEGIVLKFILIHIGVATLLGLVNKTLITFRSYFLPETAFLFNEKVVAEKALRSTLNELVEEEEITLGQSLEAHKIAKKVLGNKTSKFSIFFERVTRFFASSSVVISILSYQISIFAGGILLTAAYLILFILEDNKLINADLRDFELYVWTLSILFGFFSITFAFATSAYLKNKK